MTHCLEVAAFPWKGLAVKGWDQVFGVVTNEGDLSILQTAVTVGVELCGTASRRFRQSPELYKGLALSNIARLWHWHR